MNYRTVQLFDETTMDTQRVYRSDWFGLDEMRIVEYMAAQLVDHDYKSPVVFEIVEARWTRVQHDFQAEVLRLRRSFAIWWYFASHNRGLARGVYLDLTARRLGISPRQVKQDIEDAKGWGIPALMGVPESELAWAA